MALDTNLLVKLDANLTSALDLVTPSSPLAIAERIRLTSGTGAGQADMQWSNTSTLAASASEDIDLAGSLTGPIGGTLTFARIKLVLVMAADGNTNNVNVSRPASNSAPLFLAASDGIAVRPGGLFLWVAPGATGVAVTAATGDLLTFTNSAGSTEVTYSVVVLGASA